MNHENVSPVPSRHLQMCGLERKTKILWGKGEEGWGMEGGVKGIKGKKRYRGFLLAWFNKASKEICKALAGLHGF